MSEIARTLLRAFASLLVRAISACSTCSRNARPRSRSTTRPKASSTRWWKRSTPSIAGSKCSAFPAWARAGSAGKERFGSASAIHKRFLEWERAGVFEAIWATGLAEYDQMEGIAWRWQSIDGAMLKAPLAHEKVRPNPTDRGKKWEQASPAGRRPWRPLVVHRDRSEPA